MSATHVHIDGIVLIIFLLFASLVALLGSSVYILRSDIEIHLMDSVTERFSEEGWQFNVTFSGRDGVVSGSVKDKVMEKEIISIAESIKGVRTIDNQLEIINTSIDNIKKNNPNKISGISGISESLGGIIADTIPKSITLDPDIDDYKVPVGKKDHSNSRTDMTEKLIVEEVVIQYDTEETKLSSANEVFLST
ncbi:MAG: hypothetical protein KAG34_05190, partial [Cocleimonas sp.]|nr:hypothetical protein [Cocleimonas sp.]